MAHYCVVYIDHESAEVHADLIERCGSDYVVYRNNTVVGYIPAANVRSILPAEQPKAVDA